MSGWGVQVHDDGRTGDEAPVRVLIAAPGNVAPALNAAVAGDRRFRVVGVATSPDDMKAKLTLKPETVIVDATVFPGPEAFIQTMAAYEGDCFVLLPQGVPEDAVGALRNVGCVREVYVHPVDVVRLAGTAYEAAVARRRTQGVEADAFERYRTGGARVAGWRAIAVWSPQGGVGKSTIAAALALEAASRNVPTLLVGLGAPDPVPLALGLKPEPNIGTWRANPSAEGLKAAVQRLDDLDVLAGFPDPLVLAGYAPGALEGKDSLPALVNAAAYAGYSIVVLDVSAQELAAAALAAANTLVLVVQPTLQGLLHAREAVRLVNDVMAGQHSIARESMYMVVNRYRQSTLTPREVVQNGGELRPDFPTLAAAIPDDPAIEEALNARKPAYFHSDALRKGVKTLGDVLFPKGERREQGRKARAFGIGPIRVRL